MTRTVSTSKGSITIRSANQSDAEALFELRLEALAAHPEAFAADVEITRGRGVDAWKKLIIQDANDQSGTIIIATVGDEFIGMTGIGRGHWPKTQHTAIIWGVYVNHKWRGLRIAEAMLEECITWAHEHGIIVAKLGVVTTNQAAIRCYQRAGFAVYGTEPKSNYVDGEYYDEYLMARSV